MRGQSFLDRLKKQFGDAITGANLDAIDPWIEVSPEGLVEVCTFLRDESDLRFNMLELHQRRRLLRARPEEGGQSTWQPHMELVYHLWSVPQSREPGAEGDAAAVEERRSRRVARSSDRQRHVEHGRLARARGVRFNRRAIHRAPDLRRILCPEDWVGHPLRKDYEMPLEYHGIRGR